MFEIDLKNYHTNKWERYKAYDIEIMPVTSPMAPDGAYEVQLGQRIFNRPDSARVVITLEPITIETDRFPVLEREDGY